MSADWVQDIRDMHTHYKVHGSIKNDPEWLGKLLEFRIKFLQEELDEMKTAELPEDITDALIDLCVVAIGTLDLFGADAYGAWDEVLRANMEKKVGIKANRPNPLSLPDLIKPPTWTPPKYDKSMNGTFEQINLPLELN